MYQKDEFVTNFNKKNELFNSFFTNQCSVIINSSTTPNKLEYLAQKRLTSINFSTDDMAKIIQNLDTNRLKVMVRLILECQKYVVIQSASL